MNVIAVAEILGVGYVSAILGVAGFVATGLFWWISKHILDRIVLPRLVDWWASRNKRGALERACEILDDLHQDLDTIVNIRLAISVSVAILRNAVLAVAYLLSVQIFCLGVSIIPTRLADGNIISQGAFYASSVISILGIAYILSVTMRRQRTRRLELSDVGAYIANEHRRVSQLLSKSGVSETEIDTLLKDSADTIARKGLPGSIACFEFGDTAVAANAAWRGR